MIALVRADPVARFVAVMTGLLVGLVLLFYWQSWNTVRERAKSDYRAQVDNNDALLAACRAAKDDRAARAKAMDAQVRNWQTAVVARQETADNPTVIAEERTSAQAAADSYRRNNRVLKDTRAAEARRATRKLLTPRLRRIEGAGEYRCTVAYPPPQPPDLPSLIPFTG